MSSHESGRRPISPERPLSTIPQLLGLESRSNQHKILIIGVSNFNRAAFNLSDYRKQAAAPDSKRFRFRASVDRRDVAVILVDVKVNQRSIKYSGSAGFVPLFE